MHCMNHEVIGKLKLLTLLKLVEVKKDEAVADLSPLMIMDLTNLASNCFPRKI